MKWHLLACKIGQRGRGSCRDQGCAYTFDKCVKHVDKNRDTFNVIDSLHRQGGTNAQICLANDTCMLSIINNIHGNLHYHGPVVDDQRCSLDGVPLRVPNLNSNQKVLDYLRDVDSCEDSVSEAGSSDPSAENTEPNGSPCNVSRITPGPLTLTRDQVLNIPSNNDQGRGIMLISKLKD